ncbi:hypothetical protein [Sphingobium agri]|uniref:Uncharacterized protein n=1 Tax=Sphingobium agri TaxID=2933566 RepID=A0ABT0E0C8_9SPHN|nr:hypothetical protein [Sphingobium agri]MCK0532839.1 hypothetical protein [Sphingobium agri]
MPPPPFGLIADQCASEGLVRAPELYQRLEQSRSERAVMIEAVEQFAVGTIPLDPARSHPRSIFSKLGINRQLQLVHLIHTSFPETL